MKNLVSICLLLVPAISNAGKLPRPPDNIIGIGAEPCSEYVSAYDSMQRVLKHQEKDAGEIAGIMATYADFTGTFGGFFASAMMEHGDTKLPFKSREHAMNLAYQVCTDNPNIRFIDAIYVMSHTAFGRNVKW
jgi:hypothetical protein